MKRVRKQAITFLEVLLAIGILILITGAVVFKMKQWIDEQQSLNEMSYAAHLIANLQDLMLLANLDSTISFEKNGEGLMMKINPQSAVPYYLTSHIHQKPYLFKYIKEIQFEEGSTNQIKNPPFTISFISKGFLMNRGILKFKSPVIERKMLFLGYPTPLKLSSERNLLLPILTETLNENERITLTTFEETQ